MPLGLIESAIGGSRATPALPLRLVSSFRSIPVTGMFLGFHKLRILLCAKRTNIVYVFLAEIQRFEGLERDSDWAEIEAWTPAGALGACKNESLNANGIAPPSRLYNGMVAPFVNLTIKGVL